MRFTKTEATAMRLEILEALKVIEKKYNCSASLGGIKYGSELGVRLTFSKMASNEHGDFVNSRAAQLFIRRAQRMGIAADVLNEELVYKGAVCVITGYNSRAKKYPIEYVTNGKAYKCSIEYMKQMIRPTRPEFFL